MLPAAALVSMERLTSGTRGGASEEQNARLGRQLVLAGEGLREAAAARPAPVPLQRCTMGPVFRAPT